MSGPLVSVIMPVYQQERYVAAAFRSVLAQTYSPLEVVVADDCSTDRTFGIVEALASAYRGPHRVILHRNEWNHGIENYNVLMAKAQGVFIVQAHGDDISYPQRVDHLVRRWRETKVSLVSSNVVKIDEEGRQTGVWFVPGSVLDCTPEGLIRERWHGPCVGASLAYEREVIEAFGPFSRVQHTICTDGILPFRAALLKGISIVHQALVQFRRHSKAASERDSEQVVFLEAWQAEVMIRILGDLYSLARVRRRRPRDPRLAALRSELQREMLKQAASWSRLRTAMRSRGWRCEWTRHCAQSAAADEQVLEEAGIQPPAV